MPERPRHRLIDLIDRLEVEIWHLAVEHARRGASYIYHEWLAPTAQVCSEVSVIIVGGMQSVARVLAYPLRPSTWRTWLIRLELWVIAAGGAAGSDRGGPAPVPGMRDLAGAGADAGGRRHVRGVP